MPDPIAPPSNNTNPLNQQKPGFYGKFGSGGNIEVSYIQSVMNFDFLDKISLIEEIKGSDRWDVRDLFQRNVDDDRVSNGLIPFFKNPDAIKFFAPLALVLLPIENEEVISNLKTLEESGDDLYDTYKLNDHYEFNVHKTEPAYSFVKWNDRKVKIVAVDGQHRLSALKRLKNDPTAPEILSHMNIPILILGFSKTPEGQGNVPKLLEVVRKTFVYINSKTQKINEARRILLDDEDITCVCTQEIVQIAHSNDQKGNINDVDSGTLPLVMIDWRGEEVKGRPVPGAGSIFNVREINDWIKEYVLGDPSVESERRTQIIPRLLLEDLMPPINATDIEGLNHETTAKVREQFGKDLLPSMLYVLENLEPYKKYISAIRNLQQKSEEEASDEGRHAFKWICFGKSSLTLNREAVVQQYDHMCIQLSNLKGEIPRLLTMDIGQRAIWSSFNLLKDIKDHYEKETSSWLDFAKWYVPILNDVISDSWFNDVNDINQTLRLHLTHIVYSPSSSIVNYRLDDVSKSFGPLIMMLMLEKHGDYDLKFNAWQEARDPLKNTVKKGFKKLIKAEMDTDFTGDMQEHRDELSRRVDEALTKWEGKINKLLSL